MRRPDTGRGARLPARSLSLIEVVSATAVLTVFLLGMFSALATNQVAEVESRERQAASEAAFRQLDLVTEVPEIDEVSRNASDQDTTAVAAYEFDVPYGVGTFLPSANAGEKAGRIFVIERGSYDDDDGDEDVDDDDSQDLLEIRAEVRWTTARGVNELEIVTWKVRG